MAIIRPGAVVGAISGNLGGVNFVAGRGAPIVRQRIRKKDSQTTKQVNQRGTIDLLTKHWRDLSDVQRLMWKVEATKHQFRNRLGVKVFHSAFSIYLASAFPFYSVTGTLQDEPVPIPQSAGDISMFFQASASGAIQLVSIGNLPATHCALVRASRPFSTSTPAHPPNLRNMSYYPAGAVLLFVFTAEFDAAFGHPNQGESVTATYAIFGLGQVPIPPQVVSTIVVA